MSRATRRRPRAMPCIIPNAPVAFAFAPAYVSASTFTAAHISTRPGCRSARVLNGVAASVHRGQKQLHIRAAAAPEGDPMFAASVDRALSSGVGGDGGDGGDDDEGRDLRPVLAVGFVTFVAALVVGGWATGGLSGDTFVMLAEWFEALGPSAIFVYAALYFVLELLAVPATPLTLGCGYLFGVRAGTVAVSIAATAAAAGAFLIARYGLRDYTMKLASRYPKFRALDRAIGQEGFKFVFLLRLSPLLPFALSNYLYGLTAVNFREYVLASWAGMLPGTIAYVSAGAAIGALTDINIHHSHFNPLLIAIGAAATIGAVATIGKLATSAISETVEVEDGI